MFTLFVCIIFAIAFVLVTRFNKIVLDSERNSLVCNIYGKKKVALNSSVALKKAREPFVFEMSPLNITFLTIADPDQILISIIERKSLLNELNNTLSKCRT